MQVELVSPEDVQFSGECSQVLTRTVEGDVAFLDHHALFIGALDIGETKLWADDGVISLAVRSGFVEVSNNVVTILSDAALAADDIDLEAAQADLAAAEQALAASGAGGGAGAGGELSEADEERLEADKKWAEVRLAVAEGRA